MLNKLGKAVPLEYVQRLPEPPADPVAILWDEEKQTRLYVLTCRQTPRDGQARSWWRWIACARLGRREGLGKM